MAKRFIDTGIFDDVWFMDLSKDAKILWLYFLTKCDHAGILKLNLKLCQVQTGLNKLTDIITELGDRIVTVNEQIYFIPKFLEFQYPGFPDCKFKAARSAMEILLKYDLVDSHGNINIPSNCRVSVTEVSPDTYGIGIGIGNGNGIGKMKETESLKDRKIRLMAARRDVFRTRVFEHVDKYNETMLQEFFDYWSEATKSGGQMKYETKDTFEIPLRLATWKRNQSRFNPKDNYHATDF